MVRNSLAMILMAFLPVSVVTYAQTVGPMGQIAFTNYEDGTDQIILMNADASDSHALTDGERDAFLPVWSPDGEKIVYLENTTDQPLSERPPLRLMLMNADGSDPVEIAREQANEFIVNPTWYLDWSPDSPRLVYAVFTEEAEKPVQHFVVDLESGQT